jgi:hypothetical protein
METRQSLAVISRSKTVIDLSFHFEGQSSYILLHFPNYVKQQSGLSLIRELITLEQNFWSFNYHSGDSLCLPIVSVEANNYRIKSDDKTNIDNCDLKNWIALTK